MSVSFRVGRFTDWFDWISRVFMMFFRGMDILVVEKSVVSCSEDRGISSGKQSRPSTDSTEMVEYRKWTVEYKKWTNLNSRKLWEEHRQTTSFSRFGVYTHIVSHRACSRRKTFIKHLHGTLSVHRFIWAVTKTLVPCSIQGMNTTQFYGKYVISHEIFGSRNIKSTRIPWEFMSFQLFWMLVIPVGICFQWRSQDLEFLDVTGRKLGWING